MEMPEPSNKNVQAARALINEHPEVDFAEIADLVQGIITSLAITMSEVPEEDLDRSEVVENLMAMVADAVKDPGTAGCVILSITTQMMKLVRAVSEMTSVPFAEVVRAINEVESAVGVSGVIRKASTDPQANQPKEGDR